MDTTVEHADQRSTMKERRESLYRSIEGKIDIFVRLWEVAQSLSIPSSNDPQELIEQESQKLRGVFRTMYQQNPKTAGKFDRLKVLTQSIKWETPQETGEITDYENFESDPLQDEYMHLKGDQEVNFLAMLDEGTEMIIQRRAMIREILRRCKGKKVPSQYIPKEYKDEFLKISQLMPQRFSITVIVPEEDFDKARNKIFGPDRRIGGFYIGGTVWAIVRSSIMTKQKNALKELGMHDQIAMMFLSEELFKEIDRKNLSRTIKHEDFHAFAEGFLSLAPNRGEFIEKRIRERIEQIQRYKASPSYSDFLLRENVKLVSERLISLIDADRDELLAAFASIEERTHQPIQSFAYFLRKKQIFLLSLRGVHPQLDKEIDELLPYLDVSVLQQRIKKMYRQIAEKAPEKREALDVAFVLFPLTQIKHIERLVERWTSPHSSSEF